MNDISMNNRRSHPSNAGSAGPAHLDPAGTRARRQVWLSALGAGVLAAAMTAAVATSPAAPAASAAPPPVAAAPGSPSDVVPYAHRGTASYADLVEKVSPAVVTIRATRTVEQTGMQGAPDFLRRFFGDDAFRGQAPRQERGLGSGVVVSADGYILTNNHVVDDANRVTVELTDGRSLSAAVVGTDPPSDLAVLKVEGENFATLPLADSDRARVGDIVLAVGNPLGIGQTVTMGIISAKGRATGLADDAYEDFIQTDAPINRGNSGGALVNLRGELVGINSQILSPSGFNIGIGFAIPSNMARGVMDQLIESGEVRRGLLGVTVQPITADLARSLGLTDVRGALVNGVSAAGPAARAGLEQGDVILSLNGSPVDSGNSLRNAVARLKPGTTVTLSVQRDGRARDVQVKLGEREAERTALGGGDATEPAGGRYGMAVEPLTPELARQLGVSSQAGVVVAGVDPGSPAADAGLQRGDVIEKANRTPVRDADELKRALDAVPDGRPGLLLVNRRGNTIYVAIEKK